MDAVYAHPGTGEVGEHSICSESGRCRPDILGSRAGAEPVVQTVATSQACASQTDPQGGEAVQSQVIFPFLQGHQRQRTGFFGFIP